MIATKDKSINEIKQYPYASPNNDNSDCYCSTLGKIFDIDYVHINIVIHLVINNQLIFLEFLRIILYNCR